MKNRFLDKTFKSLKYRNFRIFFLAQIVSLLGTWIQSVAQSWLMWRITKSPALLGFLGFAQTSPILFLGLIGGVVADKANRKKLLIFTQSFAFIQAVTFAVLMIFDIITPLYIFILATALGIINAFDMTGRQTFLGDMVEPQDLGNAIALNSLLFNTARVIGPPIGGYIIAVIGEAACFMTNAISFFFVLCALFLIRIEKKREVKVSSNDSSLKDALIYFKKNHTQRNVLLVLMILSFFIFPYLYFLPYFADKVLGGKAQLLGNMFSAAGFGAIVGAILMAKNPRLETLPRILGYSSFFLSIVLTFFTLSKNLHLSLFLLFMMGFFTTISTACTNIFLQSTSPPQIRGKVISFYITFFHGFPPLGSLLTGFLTKSHNTESVLFTFSIITVLISTTYFLTHCMGKKFENC
jgi:predicted MFS family arabinose efflux permease